ncbi:hypothetical protein J437_LFUL006289 [Ladona fulva]|uniref:Uncharacterized protein n=1 Tax=Ladona fulva TaxID=123851 RepID=A0A8K0NZ21_LADFU|nr:hypothetical protein J437_LFUL006289 [Ladona fulva]
MVIVPGILPSLGVLLYFEVKDPQVTLRHAIWTPIFFLVTWCLADSWGYTMATTKSYQRIAIMSSFIAGIVTAITSQIHTSFGSLISFLLIGIIPGASLRILTVISDSILSEYFSTKSKCAIRIAFTASYSLSFILPPFIVACFAHLYGTYYARLMLAALIFHTIPASFLLKRIHSESSGRHLYLTTQPAYALLHNEVDEENEEVNENYPSGLISAASDVHKRNNNLFFEDATQESEESRVKSKVEDNNAIPLFTDVDLVAGTYQGYVAFSFDGNERKDSNVNEDVDIFVRGSGGYQRQRSLPCCCKCFRKMTNNKEFHPLTHPSFYLGLISLLAQKVISLTVWVLLPAMIRILPKLSIHGYNLSVPENIGIAVIPIMTGIASLPLVYFVPSLLHPQSYLGKRMIHGLSTIIAAIGVFAIGTELHFLHIGALMFFGLANSASAVTLETLFKEAILGSDQFLGYKNREKEWGQIQ